MSIREQVSDHFKDRLEQFCYEFFEYLVGYEEMTIAEVAVEVINGINDFHASINLEEVQRQISESNDDLEPSGEDDDDDTGASPYPEEYELNEDGTVGWNDD